MISAFTFITVDLFQTMVSHIGSGPHYDENPLIPSDRTMRSCWIPLVTGAEADSRHHLWNILDWELLFMWNPVSKTWLFPICLQTTWSWCCSPQPSLSLELPASGPDPRSSISLWVHRPVPHVPELFTFYRWFSHIWITQRLHVIRCRLSVELPFKFLKKIIIVFFLNSVCTDARQLIKDSLLCWNWGRVKRKMQKREE